MQIFIFFDIGIKKYKDENYVYNVEHDQGQPTVFHRNGYQTDFVLGGKLVYSSFSVHPKTKQSAEYLSMHR